ncbi:MAG TPA: RES family NAD+ phosphorylase [Mucilaginibacter sp.]|jgi:RES domain-containing protein
MLVYRITHKKYTDYLFAPGFSGRWNGAGRKVLYCAESIPVAFLESMIRRQGAGFNGDYNIVIIEIPDNLEIQTVSLDDLKEGWRNFRDYSMCQLIGNSWFDGFDKPVLKVPSAVLVQCNNYVINAAHNSYKDVRVVEVTELMPDARIDELLKSYKG